MKHLTAFAFLATIPLFAAEPAAPATKLAQIDTLVFSDTFQGDKLAPEWKAAKGKWDVSGGVLKGAELPEDKHGAVVRNPLKLQNMVVAFDVKLDGAKLSTLSINAPKGHLARVRLTPASFAIHLDDIDKEGPLKGKAFFTKQIQLAPDTWHSVLLEMVGDKIVGTLDENTTGQGSDPALAENIKVAPGFTVTGQSASFRNVRIYSAKAEPKKVD
jgi:hypothetical protein